MKHTGPDFEPYPQPDTIWAWLRARFGFDPAGFEGHRLWHRPGSPSIWIAPSEAAPPRDAPQLQTFGMLLTRRPPPRAKPTSVFIQRFGEAATRSVITLDEAGVGRFLMREPIAGPFEGISRGYCIARGPMGPLGCGFFDGAVLKSETPKFWREGLILP